MKLDPENRSLALPGKVWVGAPTPRTRGCNGPPGSTKKSLAGKCSILMVFTRKDGNFPWRFVSLPRVGWGFSDPERCFMFFSGGDEPASWVGCRSKVRDKYGAEDIFVTFTHQSTFLVRVKIDFQ